MYLHSRHSFSRCFCETKCSADPHHRRGGSTDGHAMDACWGNHQSVNSLKLPGHADSLQTVTVNYSGPRIQEEPTKFQRDFPIAVCTARNYYVIPLCGLCTSDCALWSLPYQIKLFVYQTRNFNCPITCVKQEWQSKTWLCTLLKTLKT